MNERNIKKLYFFIFLIIVFVGAFNNFGSFDMWWHLKSGEWMLEHHQLMTKDVFSHTFEGKPYNNFEWLYQIFIALWTKLFGSINSLIYLQVIIILFIMYFMFKSAKLLKLNFWIFLPLLLLHLSAIERTIIMRPSQFSYLFEVIMFYCIIKYEQTNNVKTLFWIPLILLIWTNMHAYIFGFFIISVYSVLKLYELYKIKEKNEVFYNHYRMIRIMFLLSILAIFMTPFVKDINIFTILFGESNYAFIHTQEYKSLVQTSFFTLSFSWIIMQIVLFSSLALFISTFNNLFKKRMWILIIFIAFLILFFKYARSAIEFYIISYFFNIYAFKYSNINSFENKFKHILLISILFMVVISFSISNFYSQNIGIHYNQQLWPEDAMDFIKTQKIEGNLFAELGHGGYLLYHLYPKIKIFIDGRTNILYDKNFLWLYINSRRNINVFNNLPKNYKPNLVLYYTTSYLIENLYFKEKWKLIYTDPFVTLLTNDSILIKNYALQHLKPEMFSNMSALIDSIKIDSTGYWMDIQKLHNLNQNSYFPNLLYGLALSLKGNLTQGLRQMNIVINKFKDISSRRKGWYYYLKGIALYENNQYKASYKVFKDGMMFFDNQKKGNGDYLLRYASVCNKLEYSHETIKILEPYVIKNPDYLLYSYYYLLAVNYFKLNNFSKAYEYFYKTLYSKNMPNADDYYNVGVSLQGLGRYTEALSYFKQAITIQRNHWDSYREEIRTFILGNYPISEIMNFIKKTAEVMDSLHYNHKKEFLQEIKTILKK